ncbi:hypothetical protein [Empedobacter sp.]|uniref:hypothetical protein n=1 Tax=Empedobacter sp. TaxID=1927715 RepID=UPI0028A05AFB|nr:hypothetical protein [Empedobacter sp.]
MDIKDRILNRISSVPIEIEKETLAGDIDFCERKTIHNFESLIFDLKGHATLFQYEFSFEKFKKWCDNYGIDVVESYNSPRHLVIRKI